MATCIVCNRGCNSSAISSAGVCPQCYKDLITEGMDPEKPIWNYYVDHDRPVGNQKQQLTQEIIQKENSKIDYQELEQEFEKFRKAIDTNIKEFTNIEKSLRTEIVERPSLKNYMKLVQILKLKISPHYQITTGNFLSSQQQSELDKEVKVLLHEIITLYTNEPIGFLWLAAEDGVSLINQSMLFRSSIELGTVHGIVSAYKYWRLAMRFSDDPALEKEAFTAFSIAIKEGLNNIHPDIEPAHSIWASAKMLINSE